MTAFAACALLVAALGVYGVLAYAVQRRTAEIGIRIALGADRRRIRSMVLLQGMSVALAGVLAGAGASLALARLLAGFLFGVAPRDPAVFVSVPALLTLVAAIAAWIPARRATRIDPIAALRTE